MSSGLKYIFELKDRNHQIQQLVDKINKHNHNKHYLDTLTSEYEKSSAKLKELNAQWERDYLPAVERRQALCRELYFAQNQPGDFRSEVFKNLQGSQRETIESLKNELQETLAEAWLYRLQLRDGLPQPHKEPEFNGSSKTAAYEENANARAADSEVAKLHKGRKKVRISWSVGAAEQELAKLEAEHTKMAQSMRSMGTQSCELAAKLNKAVEKILLLEAAMQLPTKHICYDVELEFLPLLIEAYEAYLQKSKVIGSTPPQLSLSTSIGTNSRGSSWRLSRGQQSSAPSENSAPKSPSWTISIDTAVTEWGAAKGDFLRATESSLGEIATQWALSP